MFREIKNVDNRLTTFIEVKNINDYLIYVLSSDSNKIDKFINMIFEMLKMKFMSSK